MILKLESKGTGKGMSGKKKAEEMVRERDKVIRKGEEIEKKGKQQERLQAELKKMQRVKEFKPTMNHEGDDKGKKKRGKKRPAYICGAKTSGVMYQPQN